MLIIYFFDLKNPSRRYHMVLYPAGRGVTPFSAHHKPAFRTIVATVVFRITRVIQKLFVTIIAAAREPNRANQRKRLRLPLPTRRPSIHSPARILP
jgi:hypothetical protein